MLRVLAVFAPAASPADCCTSVWQASVLPPAIEILRQAFVQLLHAMLLVHAVWAAALVCHVHAARNVNPELG